MSLVLGIDPGSRVTGYGVIDVQGNRLSYVDCGCIRTEGSSSRSAEKNIRGTLAAGGNASAVAGCDGGGFRGSECGVCT